MVPERRAKSLLALARKVMKNAYSPYSKIKVGAVLVSKDGKIFTGCSVENSAYGSTMCAERSAVFKAISEGRKSFKLLMLASSLKDFIYPCGACRQVLGEFSPAMRIIVSNGKGDRKEYSLKELFPHGFKLETSRE